jgi:GNAT superfamily N-acetyltransferase/predicted nucleic acid-binding protein
MIVRRLDPLTDESEQVHRLYRANSSMLGFLPRGAMREFVDEGCVIVAMDSSAVLGYVAYRVSGDSAKIVHLCVESGHRGHGIAKALVEELFRETANVADVRLLCREDYELTPFWPRLGFVCANEKGGRSSSGKMLFLWVRRNADRLSLLAAIDSAARANRRTVAVDANVFYDFDGADDRAQESQGLLADWLADDVAICVTAEIKNEIARNEDSTIRARRRAQVENYTVLEATSDQFEPALKLIASILPSGGLDDSDHSDRRQLAHAIAKQADYFITRDTTLLDHADGIRARTGIEVFRPTDFVVRLHSQTNDAYAPVRLVGTDVRQARVTSEEHLASFQRFGSGETKAEWLRRIRPLLTQPHRFETNMIEWDGAVRAVYAVADSDSELIIPLLRAHRDPKTPTILRRVLSELLVRARGGAPKTVRCLDGGEPSIDAALVDVGFGMRDGSFAKWTIQGVFDRDDIPSAAPIEIAQALHDPRTEIVEREYWPLKIKGRGIENYVIPIRPHWAAQLFDSELASRDLFGAKLETALALENVYYSASLMNIPEGGRILWYVSDPVKSIRACSLSLGTLRAPARALFRRFSRLGIYSWQDLMRHADGNSDEPFTAYRFGYTERLSIPVSWEMLQATLELHLGHGNQIAGPVRIPEEVFLDVYRTATGL